MKVRLLVCTVFLVLLSGCAAQYQEGLNKIDAVWQRENAELYGQAGTRYYNIAAEKVHRAMLIAVTNLGLTIEQQDSSAGFILAKGNAPAPMSMDEWNHVALVETPKAVQISGISGVTLNPSHRDVIINVITLPRKNDVQINIRARVKYTGDTYGLLIGEQAPPLATKIVLAKIFDAFEKTALVQSIVIDKSQ